MNPHALCSSKDKSENNNDNNKVSSAAILLCVLSDTKLACNRIENRKLLFRY